MLQQRSKLLLLGLAVAVLGVRIYDMAESLLLKPLSDRQVQVEDLETELLAQKRLAVRIETSRGGLIKIGSGKRCLHGNPKLQRSIKIGLSMRVRMRRLTTRR